MIPPTSSTYGQADFGRTFFGRIFTINFSIPLAIETKGKVVAPGTNVEGIYQRRHTSKGVITRVLKFYTPTNPQTEAQQANRGKLADAVIAWQGLTLGQKEVYNNRASGKSYSGYNLFIKEYLLSN